MTLTAWEFPMDRAMEYRKLAEQTRVRASNEQSSILKAEWDNLAETYTCLAEQSEHRMASTLFTIRSSMFWAGSDVELVQ
jgi:hypothetical protein